MPPCQRVHEITTKVYMAAGFRTGVAGSQAKRPDYSATAHRQSLSDDMRGTMATDIPSHPPVSDHSFIEAYNCRPILWNSRVEEYKLTERKNAACIRIELADKLGIATGKQALGLRLILIVFNMHTMLFSQNI